MVRCELTLSGAPSCRLLPGCLWGFSCLGDRYVVFVGLFWYWCCCRFDVVDFDFVVNCMLVSQKRLILILSYLILSPHPPHPRNNKQTHTIMQKTIHWAKIDPHIGYKDGDVSIYQYSLLSLYWRIYEFWEFQRRWWKKKTIVAFVQYIRQISLTGRGGKACDIMGKHRNAHFHVLRVYHGNIYMTVLRQYRRIYLCANFFYAIWNGVTSTDMYLPTIRHFKWRKIFHILICQLVRHFKWHKLVYIHVRLSMLAIWNSIIRVGA